MTEEPIESTATEVVDYEASELASSTTNLFRTDDPGEVLKRAQDTANALMPVVREKGLVSSISGREYLRVEAWTTLGAMLGVTPVCVWTRRLDNGWEARVEARTLDGRTIGAAEAECLTTEETWKSRDDFAIRSMAQTRATSKALASVLRFVATLAGFAGTPAEEMPRDTAPSGMSPKQRNFLERLLREREVTGEELLIVMAYAGAELTGGREGSVSKTIDALKKNEEGFLNRFRKAAAEWDDSQPSDMPLDESEVPEPDGDEPETMPWEEES